MTFEEILEKTKDYQMTEEEKEAQRRSFVYGNLAIDNPEVTKELVNKIADEMDKKV
jgi:hypothetical protein